MAYDRYDTRDAPRDERSRWSDDRFEDRESRSERGRRGERGFFERAGDEIASWFGDEDAERRRHRDEGRSHDERSPRPGGDRWSMAGHDEDRGFRGRDWNRQRERDWGRHEPWGGRDRGFESRERERGYRPITGDYGRGSEHESGQFFAASGVGHRERPLGERGREERFERDRSESEWGRDPYRRSSRAGSADWSDRSRHEDPNYHSWRQRHMSELDRDYDDYRRENQARFEDDFTGWRERRQSKRGLLGQVREHMEVVGNDDEHVGTIDKVAGDRIILTKSDPESGGAHHSLSCSDIDRVEGDKVKLDCSAAQARQRWRDESRGRALFEREQQGEMGPRVLDRSFGGTYRR